MQYLQQIVQELQVNSDRIINGWNNITNLPEWIKNIRVPYLLTVNNTWDFPMNFENCCFGHIERPKNSQQTDVLVKECGEAQIVLSGEAMNYENNVSPAMLQSVLSNVHKTDPVRLLFFSKAQQDYFTETGSISWNQYQKCHGLQYTNVMKININNDGSLELRGFNSMKLLDNWDMCKQLVVIFDVEALNEKE